MAFSRPIHFSSTIEHGPSPTDVTVRRRHVSDGCDAAFASDSVVMLKPSFSDRRSATWAVLALSLGLLNIIGCTETFGGGTCAEDSDCGSNATCLVDLDRGTSYCANLCSVDADCPDFQRCRVAAPGIVGVEDRGISVCVDQLRSCGDKEFCNGLDDDCDGVVDGPDCELVTRCLDDDPCGAYLCTAPENQPDAVCAPPSEGSYNYESCRADTDCRNGLCESGFCSPMCRPLDTRGCPSIVVDGMARPAVCARSVGLSSRPRHNKCQIDCITDTQCPDDLACVWRDVHQGGDTHEWVCAQLDDARKPLGAECSNNRPDEGDDECQRGLCYGRVCTRACGGFGSSCADVGPDYECRQIELFYGTLTFGAFVCVNE